MGKLSFSDLGPLHSIDAEVREVSIPIGDMTPGIHTTPDVFFELTDQGEVLWVVSRRCDHMGSFVLSRAPERHDVPRMGGNSILRI